MTGPRPARKPVKLYWYPSGPFTQTRQSAMHPMVNIAVRAARTAGSVIVRYLDRLDQLTVENKGRNDFVSEVDRMAEAAIIQVLRKAYPDHGILAEETGAERRGDWLWVIDPLDGTTNYLHGFPQFAVSIAVQHRGVTEAAVVYDPLRQELFTAQRGGGALLDGRRIRVSQHRHLQDCLLGTGFPFREPHHLDAYLGMFRDLLAGCTDLRRAGAAALDLAYVASGRLDGFWEIGLKPWDMAAGALLIQEAGGMVADFSGGDDYLDTGNIVAAHPRICRALLDTLRPHLTETLRR